MAAGDIAILFRSRDSHREFERELERVGVPFYVYKGLGFFDADEVKDVMALVQCLAEPDSRPARRGVPALALRAAVGSGALKQLAPHVAEALGAAEPPPALADRSATRTARCSRLDAPSRSRAGVALADRLAPAELVDQVLHESAYAYELRGRGHAQARENLKKLRGAGAPAAEPRLRHAGARSPSASTS